MDLLGQTFRWSHKSSWRITVGNFERVEKKETKKSKEELKGDDVAKANEKFCRRDGVMVEETKYESIDK